MGSSSSLLLSELLKQSTAVQHAALEKVFMQRLKGIRGYEDYGLFLSDLAQFIWPLEYAISRQPVSRLVPDSDHRKRGLLLAADLLTLGQPQPTAFGGHIPVVANEYAATGCLYVLEGSALGGQIIGTRILPYQGIHAHLSYYLSGAEEVKASWNNFKTEINQRIPPSNYDEVLRGAKDTFTHFRLWLLKSNQQNAVNN